MRLSKRLCSALLAIPLWVFPVPEAMAGTAHTTGEPETKVLATIGTKQITLKDIEERLQRLSPSMREDYSSEEGKQQLLRELVRIEVFCMEAEAQGLQNSAKFQNKLVEVRKALLADQFTKEQILSRATVTDEDARAYHAEHSHEFRTPEQIRVTSIFLEWPSNATAPQKAELHSLSEEIVQRVRAGEDFLDLARKHSSKSPEEDAAPFSRGRYMPEIEERLFSLGMGEISPIIEVEGGLLIFRMEDRLPERAAPYEAVRSEIIEKLRTEKSLKEFELAEGRLFSKHGVRIGVEAQAAGAGRAVTGKDDGKPIIEGKIRKVTRATKEAMKSGGKGTIFVEAGSKSAGGEDRMSVGVTAGTAIFRVEKEKRVAAVFDDLKKGATVQVYASGPVGMSYPAQADADVIIILGGFQ